MDKKQVVILDTNVLVTQPKAILAFPDALVIIPSVVIEELDNLKNSTRTEARRGSRLASNLIDDITELNEEEENEYMTLENGSILYIDSDATVDFKTREPDKPDNIIIATALKYAQLPQYDNVVLYSNDTNVRNICRTQARGKLIKHRIKARRYTITNQSLHEIESGVSNVIVSDDNLALFRKKGYLEIDLPFVSGEHLHLQAESNPEKNQGLAIWDKIQRRAVAIVDYKKGASIWKIGENAKDEVRPRDSRQNFLMNDIMDLDKNLHFVLSRVAGAGKNYITTACALSLLKNGDYDRLIMIKPMISVEGADTGYLPGTKEEKMAPWFESFNDTMTELTADGQMDLGEMAGKIELDIVTHMRGRSIPNIIMILDEAQNFSESAIKTLITRAGENAKIIIMGDLSQIDNPRLDSSNCGLRVWAERARASNGTGYDKSTYVLLDSNFRSELSSWASSFYE